MKIFVISTSALPAPARPNYGGLENIAFDSAAELARMGNEVILITTNTSTELGMHDAVDEAGVRKGYLNVISAGPTQWDVMGERQMYFNYRGLVEKEAGEGQAVIINHSWYAYVYFSLTGGTLAGGLHIEPHPNMKIMSVIHGVTGWRTQNGYSPPKTKYPRLIGVSRGHAQYLSNCFGLPVRHVHNGTNIPPKPEQWTQGTYLLSLNRISREKGIHNAIDVALATRTPIRIVGDDQHVADPMYVWEIMQKCDESGGLAEYIGLVSNDDKDNYIKGCKALIACPDMGNYVESFYLGAIEGFAYGKPILALPNGGLTDTVKNGVNGFLCANVERMKEVLVSGANGMRLEDMNPDVIRQEAERYTVEAMARGYEDLCKGILNNDPAYQW